MCVSRHFCWVLIGMSFCLASCGGNDNSAQYGKVLKPVPVHGKVQIDGKPYQPEEGKLAQLTIRAVPLKPVGTAADQKINAGVSTGAVDPSGEFWMMSYKAKDGLPPGEYALTFSLITDPRRKTDALKNRYDTVENSPKKITVEAGKPLDVGTIELTME